MKVALVKERVSRLFPVLSQWSDGGAAGAAGYRVAVALRQCAAIRSADSAVG
jgi:hypothetical protein